MFDCLHKGLFDFIFLLAPFFVSTRQIQYNHSKTKSSTSFELFFQKNTGQNGGKPKLDLNVGAAWAQGVTGKNVTTAIMDDGKLDRLYYENFFV